MSSMKFASHVTAAMIAISGVFTSTGASAADAYPTRSIMLVIPFPPGGGTDIVGRLLANKLGAALGKTVVVENRPGAGSAIGAGFVAQANPDGYTLLLASGSPLIVAPLFSKTTYDPVKSFAPICLMASSPFVLSVSPTISAKTPEELIALARAKPGQLNMASFGNGSSSHITGEMFKSMAHVDMVHVPYKGSVPAITELMGGQVQVMFDVLSSALPYYKAGKLRILAVTGTKRSSILPEVPVLADTLPGFESSTWFGVVAPAGTPAPIIARLNAEIIKALADAEVRKVLDEQSLEPIGSTPEQFAQKIDSEIVKWRKVINGAGVKP
jgi:tripartite-type tricarboxylate transporter receptor subunit TctC